MIKEKHPDGFPKEFNGSMDNYPCDNCGKEFDANNDQDRIEAAGRAKAGKPYHCYEFCCEDCAYEFAVDNGLVLHKSDDNVTDYDLTIAKKGENPGYAPAEDDDKPKHKLCPDGFPDENHTHNGLYDCDNCGLAGDFNQGYRVDAISDDGKHDLLHMYSFCDQKCAEEFASRYGLVMVEATDDDHDKSVNTDFTFKHVDPVAAAVKTILPEDVTPEDATSDTSDSNQDTQLADNQEELFAADDPVHKKKITECWANVIERAKEIAAVAQKIVETKETLKYYQKEYEALVKKQNDYILTNGNGIQLTFDDVKDDQGEKQDTPAAEELEPVTDSNGEQLIDPDGWKEQSVRELPGFTQKQMEKIEANFRTLREVQEWSCKDYREKMPGIGQALQDKLIDALSDYAVAWQQKAKEQQQTDEPAAEPEPTEEAENV